MLKKLRGQSFYSRKVLNINLDCLLGGQGLNDGGEAESANEGVGQEHFEDDLLVGVVAEGSCGLNRLAQLQGRKVDLVVADSQVRPHHLAVVVDVKFAGGNLASDNPAADVVLFPIAPAVL